MFSDNCYLIRHGNEWMLWDSGYADSLVDKPEGIVGPRSTALRKRTLVSQLAEIGVAPGPGHRLAFSHSHGDHVGNGNLFTAATLYIQKAEYAAAFGSEPAKYGFRAGDLRPPAQQSRHPARRRLRCLRRRLGANPATPGHTPGHQSLLVRLPQTGAVVLSGDAAHFEENFTKRRVPGFNFDKDQSLQSMDKLDRIVKAERAQLWINHDAAQNATLLHSPKFYQ